jgi:membrane protein
MGTLSGIKTKLIGTPPVRIINRWSKSIRLMGFYGSSLYLVSSTLYRQFRKTSISERAAAISFNIFMAIPPTLLFAFTLIPLLPISEQFITELYHVIRDVMPGKEYHTVLIEFMDDFLNTPKNELLSFGLLVALFFSSNAMMGIMRAFDKNYAGFKRRGTLKKRQIAIRLTLTVYFLVFFSIILLIAQNEVLKWVGIENKYLRAAIINSRWIIIILSIFYSVASIYRLGPSTTRKWKYLTPGSVFTTAMMVISSLLVSVWVDNFSSYNKLYGSIGAIFISMSFIYINSLVVLVGFELNVVRGLLQRQKSIRSHKTEIKGANQLSPERG